MYPSPTIAIIGEDPSVAALLRRMILRVAPTATVQIAPEAAALPAGFSPDIAIVRASPYHLAGYVDLRALRAASPCTLCVALTSLPGEVGPVVQRAGAHLMLAKPFTAVAVQELLKRAWTPAGAAPAPCGC